MDIFLREPLLGGFGAASGKSKRLELELHHLRCFVAVSEELHFGRAAARLNMTQPPLSRQIQNLEQVVDLKLLDRTTNRAVKLTPAGRAFLLEARRILRMVETAAQTTRRFLSGEAGVINLGFTATIGYSFLPRLLLRCATELPNVHIALKEMVSRAQVDYLRTGHLDVALLRPPTVLGEFITQKLSEERLVAALPVGDPRLSQDSLSLKDFDHQPLIMYSKEGAPYFNDLVTGLLEAEGVEPRVMHSLDQIHSMLSLVRARIGPALVPESAMVLHFEDVYFRPVDINSSPRPVKLLGAWGRANDNPVLAVFLDLLRSIEQDNTINIGEFA